MLEALYSWLVAAVWALNIAAWVALVGFVDARWTRRKQRQ
jgi:hypothetical protein